MKKADFMATLKELDMKKKDFAALCGLKPLSVNNWSDEKFPIPSWVEPFLEYYKKSLKYDEIVKIVEK